MTGKRFTVEKLDLVSDHLSTRFFIVDNENMVSYDVQHIVSEGFEVQFGSWAEKIADKLNDLSDENEQLKQFIQELATKGTGKILLADGSIYKVDTILINIKGDVE